MLVELVIGTRRNPIETNRLNQLKTKDRCKWPSMWSPRPKTSKQMLGEFYFIRKIIDPLKNLMLFKTCYL